MIFSTTTSFALPTRYTPRNNSLILLVLDTLRNRLVLVGGADGAGNALDDWWQFLLDEPERGWEQFFPVITGTFVARSNHAGYYDSERDKIVVYGGLDNASAFLDDVWELSDGVNLAEVTPATTTPGGRFGTRFTYDPVRKLGVMFAGTDNLFADTDETLTWDGLDFTLLAPATTPPSRSSHAQAWDPERQQTIITHGDDDFDPTLLDTWGFDGTTWAQIGSANPPSGRRQPALGYHPRRRTMLLFGGNDGTDALADTFELPPAAGWDELHPDTSPSARYQAYIHPWAERGVAVLNGGTFDLTTSPIDVWESDAGAEWSLTKQGLEYDSDVVKVDDGATLEDPGATAAGTIAPSPTVRIDGLLTVNLKDDAPANTELRLILELDEVPTWWDGDAWVTSDGSAAQSNTEAEIGDNLAALTVAGGTDYRPIVWLISTDGIATPEAEEVVSSALFAVPEVTPPRKVLIWAKTQDFTGDDIQGALLRITGPATGFFHGETHIRQTVKSEPSNAAGEVELEAYETETIGQLVTLELDVGVTKISKSVLIPNQDLVSAKDLLT